MEKMNIGQSRLGKVIELYSLNGLRDECIAIIGGIHGDEPEALEVSLKCLDELSHGHRYSNCVFIPCLNPDGCSDKTRKNADGIDLNRNFPAKNAALTQKSGNYQSASPLSEPESRALYNLLEFVKPKLIVTLHTPFELIDFDGPATDECVDTLGKTLGLPVEQIGSRPGSMGSYYGVDQKIPFITLELPEKLSGRLYRRYAKKLAHWLAYK
jgi:protein MpaA